MVEKVKEGSTQDCAVPQVWTFKDDDVAANFQFHVQHQLPWYNTVTEFVQSLILSYAEEGTTIYDIGCSKGNVTKALKPQLDSMKITCVGFDSSPQMVAQYQGAGTAYEELAADVFNPTAVPETHDFSVAVCFLSMMFMPQEQRFTVLTALKRLCRAGGAIIIVDKEAPKGGYLGTAMSRARMQLKANQGVPLDQIMAKELSLAGVQRPIDPDRELIGDWKEFFRMGEFVGWIYEQKV